MGCIDWSMKCRERFPRHRGLTIPTYITARASRTCRDACRDHREAVSFEVGGGENVPGNPGSCAIRNFTYLVRGPWYLFHYVSDLHIRSVALLLHCKVPQYLHANYYSDARKIDMIASDAILPLWDHRLEIDNPSWNKGPIPIVLMLQKTNFLTLLWKFGHNS